MAHRAHHTMYGRSRIVASKFLPISVCRDLQRRPAGKFQSKQYEVQLRVLYSQFINHRLHKSFLKADEPLQYPVVALITVDTRSS